MTILAGDVYKGRVNRYVVVTAGLGGVIVDIFRRGRYSGRMNFQVCEVKQMPLIGRNYQERVFK